MGLSAATAPEARTFNNNGLMPTPAGFEPTWEGRKHIKGPGRQMANFQIICAIFKDTIKLLGIVRLEKAVNPEFADFSFTYELTNRPKEGKPRHIKANRPTDEEILPMFLQHPEDFTVIIEPLAARVGLHRYKMTLSNNQQFRLLTVEPSKPVFPPQKKKSIHFFSFSNVREFAYLAQHDKSDTIRDIKNGMVREFLLRSPNASDVYEILEIYPTLEPGQKEDVMKHLTLKMQGSFTVDAKHAEALKEIFNHYQKFSGPGHVSLESEDDIKKSIDSLEKEQTKNFSDREDNHLSGGLLKNVITILKDCLMKEQDNTALFTGAQTREEAIRERSAEAIEVLRALASLLELLLKAKIRTISRTAVQEPLLDILKFYRRHPDPKVAFLSEYNYYLTYLLKNNESGWHEFLRVSSYILLGVSKLAEVYSSKDITKIHDSFSKVKKGFVGIVDDFKKVAPPLISVVSKAVEGVAGAVPQFQKVETTLVLTEWPGLYFSIKQSLIDETDHGFSMLMGLNALLKMASKEIVKKTTPPSERVNSEREAQAQKEASEILESYPTHNPFFVSGLVEVLSNLLKKCSKGAVLPSEEKKEGEREMVILDLLLNIFIDNLPEVKGVPEPSQKRWFKINQSIFSQFQNGIRIGKELIECGKTEGATNYQYLLIDIHKTLRHCWKSHPNPRVRHRASEIFDVCEDTVQKLSQAAATNKESLALDLPKRKLTDGYKPHTPPPLLHSSILGTALQNYSWRKDIQLLRSSVTNDLILTQEDEIYVRLNVLVKKEEKTDSKGSTSKEIKEPFQKDVKTVFIKDKKELFSTVINDFLYPPGVKRKEDDPNRVLLVTGQLGSGKSLGIRYEARELWDQYKEGRYFPIIIPLTRSTSPATAVKDFFGSPRNLDVAELAKKDIVIIFESLDEIGALNYNLVELNQELDVNHKWKFIVMCRPTLTPDQKRFLWPQEGEKGFREVVLAPFGKYQKLAGWHKQIESLKSKGKETPWEVENFIEYEDQEENASVKELTKIPLYHSRSARTLPALIERVRAEKRTKFTKNEFIQALFIYGIFRELNAQSKCLARMKLGYVITGDAKILDHNIRLHALFDPYITEQSGVDSSLPKLQLEPKKIVEEKKHGSKEHKHGHRDQKTETPPQLIKKEADIPKEKKSKPDPKIPNADLDNGGEGLKQKLSAYPKKNFPLKELDQRVGELIVRENVVEYFYKRCCPITDRGDSLQWIHASFWDIVQGMREDPDIKEDMLISMDKYRKEFRDV